MRVFVAIELPEEKKEQLVLGRKSLEKVNAEVKWIEKNAIHFTLKFLGEVSGSKVEEIKNNLRHAISGFGPFKINIKGFGVFPHYVNPRIIWVGIHEREKLKQLHQIVEEICFLSGFEKEKRDFIAHLSLGRVRYLKDKNGLIQKIKELNTLSFGEIQIKEISLMESWLYPSGAKYTCLEKINL